MPQTSAQRPRPALHHRKSVGRLTGQQLSDLRRAYGAVLPIRDERGYNHHAGIHGLPLPIYCKHGDILFLPWHRAYLYFFELALRDQVPNASLPWWNWASRAAHASGIPQTYAAKQVDGQDNPLYSVPFPEIARQQGSRQLGGEPPTNTFRRPGRPADLPTAEDVEAALGAPNFVDFSNRMENLHNWVHVWIGGTTAEVPWAAYDPLFWAHHAMVDRLWRVWQLRNPEPNLDRGLLRQALPPFNMTVEDTLDVTALGYEYASTTQSVGGGRLMAPNRYISGPIAMPLPQGAEDGADFSRADLEFHGIDHSGSSFEARVFLNNPDADETTPREGGSGYAGSFYVFGHGGCFGDVGHCDVPEGPRGPFDRRPPHPLTPQKRTVVVTQAIKRLRDTVGGDLTVTVVPVASESPIGAEDDLLRFERLALITYD